MKERNVLHIVSPIFKSNSLYSSSAGTVFFVKYLYQISNMVKDNNGSNTGTENKESNFRIAVIM